MSRSVHENNRLHDVSTDGTAAEAARGGGLRTVLSKCGADCRTCERRAACGAFLTDFSLIGR